MSSVLDNALREELLDMVQADERARAELAGDDTPIQGHHPKLEQVQRQNAARLSGILDECGWPGRALVGSDGARAACLIVHYAVGEPAFQRRALQLLRSAAARGDVPLLDVATLEDRVRAAEGRPQRYGTQFDWDEHGLMSPLPVEDPEHVDERRRAVGLGTLAEATRRRRERVAQAHEQAPTDWLARRRAAEEWYRQRGWRE